MKKTLLALGALVCASPAALAADTGAIDAALKHQARPETDMIRDADRHPADILAFLDVEKGMTLVDFIAGRGYYSEIFSHFLADTGRLYSVRGRAGSRDFSAYKNITETRDLYLEDVDAPVDRILTALNYHDIINNKDVDRARMLQAIRAKLADDGYLVVIDHNTRPGVRDAETKTKHRVEAAFVLNEILAAGFRLDAISSVLANPADDFDQDVWQTSTKGKTDRFVYRFTKN